MITKQPTQEMLEEWKALWLQYKDRLIPNRKSGAELLGYLQCKYTLTEIYDKHAAGVIIGNVTMNTCYAEKLPESVAPVPRAFFLENIGNGKVIYQNKDSKDVWDTSIPKVFIGIDMISGFFMVEGSTMLWDELYAYRGLDEKDIKNYVSVAEYISCLKRFNLLQGFLNNKSGASNNEN